MTIGITRKNNAQVSTLNKNQSGGKTGKTGSQTSTSGTASGSSSPRTDSVNLTASATQLQELENRIASMPVVDAQIVDAVQQQLSTGTFEINEKSTANKLLDTEKKLAGSD
jgi:negative regulator of flagellin synthesis FlgM